MLPIFMVCSLRLMLFGVDAPDARDDGVWLMVCLPGSGLKGMAALSFRTPWPLIQI